MQQQHVHQQYAAASGFGIYTSRTRFRRFRLYSSFASRRGVAGVRGRCGDGADGHKADGGAAPRDALLLAHGHGRMGATGLGVCPCASSGVWLTGPCSACSQTTYMGTVDELRTLDSRYAATRDSITLLLDVGRASVSTLATRLYSDVFHGVAVRCPNRCRLPQPTSATDVAVRACCCCIP
jgi:hypothetical protein